MSTSSLAAAIHSIPRRLGEVTLYGEHDYVCGNLASILGEGQMRHWPTLRQLDRTVSYRRVLVCAVCHKVRFMMILAEHPNIPVACDPLSKITGVLSYLSKVPS